MIHYDLEIQPNNHAFDDILKGGVPSGVSAGVSGEKSAGMPERVSAGATDEKSDGVPSGVSETLSVDVFSMPILDSRMYVLSYDKQPTSGSKELLIVDPNYIPPEEVDNLKTICAGASSASVLFTHSHYDHIAGLELLRSLLRVKSYANSICNEKMRDSHKNLAAFSMALVLDKTEEMQKYCEKHFDFDYRCEADEIYSFSANREDDNHQAANFRLGLESEPVTKTDLNAEHSSDSITRNYSKVNPNLIYGPDFKFGKYKIRTVYTPGHSDCSQCLELYCDVSKKMSSSYSPIAIFTGDSLVNGHNTITRFPSGNKKIYKNITVPYLNSLDESTIVLPGHGETARLAELIEFSNI